MRPKTTRDTAERQRTDGRDTGTLKTPRPLSPTLAAVRDRSHRHITHTVGCKRPYKRPTQAHSVHTELNSNTSFGSQPFISCDAISYFKKRNKEKKHFKVTHEPILNSILHQIKAIVYRFFLYIRKTVTFLCLSAFLSSPPRSTTATAASTVLRGPHNSFHSNFK